MEIYFLDMRGGKLVFTNSDEEVPIKQTSEDNLAIVPYNKKIKIWVILLILFIFISLVTNMLATKNKPTTEEKFICVSLGYDYYEPGDWNCKEIRDDYDAYKTQILISYIAYLPIGFSLVSIGVNLKRKKAHKQTQNIDLTQLNKYSR